MLNFASMKITAKGYRLLRRFRIAISLLIMAACGAAVALGYDSLFSRWQIVPALLACSLAWVALWALSALLLGRVYCSAVCPLGTLQDCLIALSRRRRRGFFYRSPSTALRWSVVIVAAACLALEFPVAAYLVDPASAFSRIASYLTIPFIRPAAFSLLGASFAAVTLLVVAWIALTRGRRLCNTLCPVGTALGALSGYSLYHVDINTDKCTGCGLCVSRCKSECIDPSAHTVDLSRCVVCLDCTAACPSGAITLRRGRHRLQMPLMQPTVAADATVKTLDRRAFLAAVAGSASLTALAGWPREKQLNPVTPPGVQSRADYQMRCTGCGICVSACPSGIIRPSVSELGIRKMLHPVLDFSRGACLYDCVRCTQVCPTDALQTLTLAEKHSRPIGKARIVAADCIEYSRGQTCGICERRCPARAIHIIPDGLTADNRPRRLPTLRFDDCIGCGACAYYCPADPVAWVIEGE